MFKMHWMIVIESPDKVDKLSRIASNNNLVCLYKIGVYGKERQDEIHLIGNLFDYTRFKRELQEK